MNKGKLGDLYRRKGMCHYRAAGDCYFKSATLETKITEGSESLITGSTSTARTIMAPMVP
jgi:hypothetical protein